MSTTAADTNKHAQQILSALELANSKGAFKLEEATAAFVAYINIVKILNEYLAPVVPVPASAPLAPIVEEEKKEE